MEKILTFLFEKQPDFLEHHHENDFSSLFKINYLPIEEKKANQKFIWQQIVESVKKAKDSKRDKIILCENAEVLHSGTDFNALLRVINEAHNFRTKLLAGNISSEDATLVPVSDSLFWTDSLTNFKFLVIYKSCFDLILTEDFDGYHCITECLESITSNKMLIYPMINIFTPDPNHKLVKERIKRLMRMRTRLKTNNLKLSGND